MPAPAPCGLRVAHDEHELEDGTTCPGKPWPRHYEAHHRGRYMAEPDWDQAAPMGKHREDGPPVLVHEPDPPRPHLRLGWHDKE